MSKIDDNIEVNTIPINITIGKNEHDLQEIFSRVTDNRGFVKEAMLYWFLILKHSDLYSRYAIIPASERVLLKGLFPKEYFEARYNIAINPIIDDPKPISIRIKVGANDPYFEEILKKLSSDSGFAKEAVFEWDRLLSHSHLFVSSFIKKKTDTPKGWGIFEMQVKNGTQMSLGTDNMLGSSFATNSFNNTDLSRQVGNSLDIHSTSEVSAPKNTGSNVTTDIKNTGDIVTIDMNNEIPQGPNTMTQNEQPNNEETTNEESPENKRPATPPRGGFRRGRTNALS